MPRNDTPPPAERADGRARMVTDIADACDRLTEPYVHSEPIEEWDRNRHRKVRKVVTEHASLLTQLAEAVLPGAAEGAAAGGFSSGEPCDLDAVACLGVIQVGAAKWAWDLRVDMRSSTASTLRALVGAAASADSSMQAGLLHDLQAWVRWAEEATKWRQPPHVLRAPCPALVRDEGTDEQRECGARGIRVRTDPMSAWCPVCRTTWDAVTVQVLGRHEQAYRERADADAAEARKKERDRKAVDAQRLNRACATAGNWATLDGRDHEHAPT